MKTGSCFPTAICPRDQRVTREYAEWNRSNTAVCEFAKDDFISVDCLYARAGFVRRQELARLNAGNSATHGNRNAVLAPRASTR